MTDGRLRHGLADRGLALIVFTMSRRSQNSTGKPRFSNNASGGLAKPSHAGRSSRDAFRSPARLGAEMSRQSVPSGNTRGTGHWHDHLCRRTDRAVRMRRLHHKSHSGQGGLYSILCSAGDEHTLRQGVLLPRTARRSAVIGALCSRDKKSPRGEERGRCSARIRLRDGGIRPESFRTIRYAYPACRQGDGPRARTTRCCLRLALWTRRANYQLERAGHGESHLSLPIH